VRDTVHPDAAPVITMVGVPVGTNDGGSTSRNDFMLSVFPQLPLEPVTVAVNVVRVARLAVVGEIVYVHVGARATAIGAIPSEVTSLVFADMAN
jgi:hypothetical protein